MLALCQHNTLAYYAFYYAGVFDASTYNWNVGPLLSLKRKGIGFYYSWNLPDSSYYYYNICLNDSGIGPVANSALTNICLNDP